MLRNTWASFGFWVLIGLSGAVASAQTLLLPPRGEALYDFSRDTRLLADLVGQLERRYPNAAIPLLKDVQANPQPWYHEQFAVLLQQAVAIGNNQTRIDWVFSKWPNNLAAVAAGLDQQYRATGSSPVIQPLFFNAQDAYVRSLSSTYLLIEGIKRQYLNAPWGPSFPGPAERDFIASQLMQLHAVVQHVARWMYGFRCSTDFAFLFSVQYFVPNEALEVRYRSNFFIGQPIGLDGTNDLATLMLPVATADEWKAKIIQGGVKIVPLPGTNPAPSNPGPVNPGQTNPGPVNPNPGQTNPGPVNPNPGQTNPGPVNPNPGQTNPGPVNPNPGQTNPGPVNPNPGQTNPGPVNPNPGQTNPGPVNPGSSPIDAAQWQKDWDEVQRQLAQSPDDLRLRQRLWELEQQKKSLPAPVQTQNPAPLQPTPAQPPNQGKPAPLPNQQPQNTTEIERIQRLLQKPDVQANAELKHELEELLKSLQGGQPAPQPVPPQTWASGATGN